MKALLLSTALAAGFALPSLAQDAPVSPFQAEAAGPAAYASEIIGARVYVSEAALDADAYEGVQEGWDDIGEVNDVLLGRDGTVDAVLVDIGGFLGMGERQVAVDMSSLKFVSDDATDADDWFLVLQTDRATLEGAPEYLRPAMGDQAAATDTDKGGLENVPVVNEAISDTAEAAPDTTGQGTATDEAVAASNTAEGTEGVGSATETALPADGGATADATGMNGSMALPEGYTAMGPEALTAETLTGADVRDASDASIAEVSDLVLSAEGQVTDVVLDVGGFLGMGAKSVAIPMDRLTVAQTEGGAVRVWVDMTKEELEALPEYKA
ncbi:PRC-barrel domain-containing protein [Rhodobacter sp. SY28-1]|uniref:PRC-barrel domain-containing protein n=1 Tax=Rhodobacter sp. SY28-1 TaxID=2562317 RepID=UPI0010C13A37|nr:PRC-barrel domain-containing protein [Rhodobacter sp. SY28-1]